MGLKIFLKDYTYIIIRLFRILLFKNLDECTRCNVFYFWEAQLHFKIYSDQNTVFILSQHVTQIILVLFI